MTPDTLSRQVEAIARWLAIFHPPGDVVELRALNVAGKRAVCEVFGNVASLAARAAELDAASATGCYFTLNPLRPDLAGSKTSCRKADVIERHWLPLDIDPYRPKDTSSTDAELQAAWAVLDRCRGLLDAAGLRGAVVGHSGNGWHLCYPIALPSDDASQAMLKAVLKGLHARCGDLLTTEEVETLKAGTPLPMSRAKVEEDVHDAPRIWKLYGTRARKGVATADRPHRWTRLVEGEPWDRATGEANAARLAELLAEWQHVQDSRRGRPQTNADTYAAAAFRQELAALAGAIVGDRNNQLNRSAFAIGTLVGAGAISRAQAEAELLAVALSIGLGEGEAAASIKSGLDAGTAKPRDLSTVGQPGRAAPAHASAVAGAASAAPATAGPAHLQTTLARDVKVQLIHWLVPDLIPLGKLTMIAGDGGHGKSSLTLDLIATLTTGRPCFGVEYPCGEPADALLISCEDDLADTVVPRLMAAGADTGRVRHVDGVVGPDGKLSPFCLAHYEALEDHLARHPTTRLVVIDPAGAYVGASGVDDHKDSELRSLLAPLSDLAARRKVAIVLVKHLNKGVNSKAAARVGGSVGYVNAVRSALLVAPDPNDDSRKLLLSLKANLTPKRTSVAYRLKTLAPADAAQILAPLDYLSDQERGALAAQLYRVEWLGPVLMTADEALAPCDHKKKANEAQQAEEWLREFLLGSPRRSAECCSKGNEAIGINRDLRWWRDTILKERLHGMPRRTGFGNSGTWWFALASHPWPFPNLGSGDNDPPEFWTPFTDEPADSPSNLPD